MANLGFILKESVMNVCSEMSSEMFKETITGLFNYAAYGVEPDFDNPIQKAVFFMEKPAIDYNLSKWQEKERNKTNKYF